MGTQNRIRSRNREGGQAAVEFALTATFLFLLILSVVELTMFVYAYAVSADAAKEGVRYAIVHGTNSSSANGPGTGGSVSNPPCTVTNAVTNNAATGASVAGVTSAVDQALQLSGHNYANMNVYVCYLDGDNKLNSLVDVVVTYQYTPFFFSWPRVTVNANSAGRIVF